MVNNAIVSAVYVKVCEVDPSVQDSRSFFILHPPTNGTPLLPPLITTDDSNANKKFGKCGTRQEHHSDNNSIASVKIARSQHQFPLHDVNENNIL